MSDLAERAIQGEDKQAFDDLRKLTACALVVSTGESGEEAAVEADKGIFQKTVEYAVGCGEMAADNAVDALIDRQACRFSEIVHKTVKKVVDTGCSFVGGWIGHYFGPKGTELGQKIGAKIAEVLNTNLSPLIEKGIDKLKDVAKSVYEKGKSMLKSAGQAIINKFFG